MFLRKFVSAVAISSAVVLGTSACSITNNIPTLQSYAPSDGAQADINGVKALNLIYLTKRDVNANEPEVGALIGTFVNSTNKDVEVHIQYEEDTAAALDVFSPGTGDYSFVVPAGGKVDFGYNESPALYALLVTRKGTKSYPGDLVSVKFEVVGDSKKVDLNVPALDGSLEQYSALVENLIYAQAPEAEGF